MGFKIAIALWSFLDIMGIALSAILFLNLEPLEKGIVFCLTTTFLIYRICLMHQDLRKKKLENDEREFDLKTKKNKQS